MLFHTIIVASPGSFSALRQVALTVAPLEELLFQGSMQHLAFIQGASQNAGLRRYLCQSAFHLVVRFVLSLRGTQTAADTTICGADRISPPISG